MESAAQVRRESSGSPLREPRIEALQGIGQHDAVVHLGLRDTRPEHTHRRDSPRVSDGWRIAEFSQPTSKALCVGETTRGTEETFHGFGLRGETTHSSVQKGVSDGRSRGVTN